MSSPVRRCNGGCRSASVACNFSAAAAAPLHLPARVTRDSPLAIVATNHALQFLVRVRVRSQQSGCSHVGWQSRSAYFIKLPPSAKILVSIRTFAFRRGFSIAVHRSFIVNRSAPREEDRTCNGPANFGVKLTRPSFGPAAELPALSPARRRHGGCSSRLGAAHVIRGNRRAAPTSAQRTGRTAYTKDVGQTGNCDDRSRLSPKLECNSRDRSDEHIRTNRSLIPGGDACLSKLLAFGAGSPLRLLLAEATARLKAW